MNENLTNRTPNLSTGGGGCDGLEIFMRILPSSKYSLFKVSRPKLSMKMTKMDQTTQRRKTPPRANLGRSNKARIPKGGGIYLTVVTHFPT